MKRSAVVLAAFALGAPLAAHAQQPAALDRTKPPALSPAHAFKLPAVTKGALTNGIAIEVVEHHTLPLVQLILVVEGGSRLDGNQHGLASFTARMLTEGAGTRDANALQSELAFLGAQLSATSSSEAITVQLSVAKRSFAEALDLMADIVLRPTFPAMNVKQQRDLRLSSMLQRRDQPTSIASIAFNQIVFPAGHPYHDPLDGDSSSAAALDSARVRTFYESAMVPERAKFVAVGDITETELRALLASRFGAWKRSATPAPIPPVTVKPVVNDAVRIYLIDKPNAAQSVIELGAPGADRTSPDYPAVVVMNTLLGASFSSRLNQNLRETKGYTYGVSSRFGWQPIPGAFEIATSVRTNVTDSSLVEIFRELRAIRDAQADSVELARAKAYVALGVPGRFETNGGIAGQLLTLDGFHLPLSSTSDFIAKVNAVSAADLQRVARQYIPADRVTLVIVGDLAKIRAGVEALKLGAITVLDVSAVAR